MKAVQDGSLDLVITRVISDRPAPVLEIARSHGFQSALVDYSLFNNRQEWSDALVTLIDDDHVDLVVSLGFMRILPANFLTHFKVINTHPALLPLFPGAHAVRDALSAGVLETGTSVHWVDSGVDTGKVISQVAVEILAGDTEESLHERIKIQERKLIVETLQNFSRGKLGQS